MAPTLYEKVRITPAQQQELQAYFANMEKRAIIGLVVYGILCLLGNLSAFLINNELYEGILIIFVPSFLLFFLVKKLLQERQKDIASGQVPKRLLRFLKHNPYPSV